MKSIPVFKQRQTTRSRRPRGAPEHKLQVSVCQYLLWCLPDSIEWTANAAGVYVSQLVASKMKAAGVRRGWPDLQFLFPDGVTRYIELKTDQGSLSAEQREFAQRCRQHDIFAVCRSIDEVVATLTRWGVALKAHPFRDANIDQAALRSEGAAA